MGSSQLSIMHGGQSVNVNSGTDNGQECATTNLSGRKYIQKNRNTEIQKYRNTEIQKYGNTDIQNIKHSVGEQKCSQPSLWNSFPSPSPVCSKAVQNSGNSSKMGAWASLKVQPHWRCNFESYLSAARAQFFH